MNEISNFILYTTPNGHVQLDILLQDENLWLTQKGLAELFGVERSVITKHLKNIYDSGELDKMSTCAKFAQVQQEGNRTVRRELEYYNLDAIISVGYRVNSSKATQFRIWATKTLKEFIIKGFVLDDERLKQNVLFYESAQSLMPRISMPTLVSQRLPTQQVFRLSRPWKMRFIIWSIFCPSVIKRKISQLVMELSSKRRTRSLALLISTIATKMMCLSSATPCTQTIGVEDMYQKQRVP